MNLNFFTILTIISIFLAMILSLLFFVNSFLKKKDVFNYRNSVYFLPFILAVICLLVFYNGVGRFIIWESSIDINSTILILVHNLIYIVISF